jgi:tetratricopeptide (TPR) repeat protein
MKRMKKMKEGNKFFLLALIIRGWFNTARLCRALSMQRLERMVVQHHCKNFLTERASWSPQRLPKIPRGSAARRLIVPLLFSCSLKEAGEETLLLYIKAAALYSEGKFNDALAVLETPENGKEIKSFVPAIVLRGKVHYFPGAFHEAENQFRMALKLRPAQKEASLYLARTWREEQSTMALWGFHHQKMLKRRFVNRLENSHAPSGNINR